MEMRMRFFFYGTLLDPEVRREVMGRAAGALPAEPAVLAGYRRVYVRGKTYPVAVPDPASAVEGCLVRGLDRRAAQRLIDFETDEYDLVERTVVTGSGRTIRCRVFVAGRRALPSVRPWDYETWRRRHRSAFGRRLRRGIV
jgi:gamma-glutamylcyclotransferase (GGCT)/AIG2-like uncharacterized protein YtfP